MTKNQWNKPSIAFPLSNFYCSLLELILLLFIVFHCLVLVSNLLWFIHFLYCVVLPLIYCGLLFTIVTYCPLFIVVYQHIPLWVIGLILLLCIVWYCNLFFLCYCGLSTHKLLWFIGICYFGLLWQLFFVALRLVIWPPTPEPAQKVNMSGAYSSIGAYSFKVSLFVK